MTSAAPPTGYHTLRSQDILNSGLNSLRKQLGTISQDMAQADDVASGHYARRQRYISEDRINGVPSGVTTSEAFLSLQEATLSTMRESLSALQQSSVKSDFYGRYEAIVGESGRGATFAHSSEAMITSLNQLTGMVNGTNRQMFMNTLTTHLGDLRRLYNSVHDIRHEADKRLEKSVAKVDSLITKIAEANKNIMSSSGSPDTQLEWIDSRRAHIQELTQLVGVRVKMRDDQASIYLINSGSAIVQGSESARLSYTAATDVTASTAFSAITLSDINGNSSRDITASLLTNGDIDQRTLYGGGEIRALLELRDVELASLYQRLDTYAENLRDNFNRLHNTGASFLAANTTLTGTVGLPGTGAAITGPTLIAGQGNLRIAVVDTANNQVSNFTDIDLSTVTNINSLITAINLTPDVNAAINASGQLEISYTGGAADRGISLGETGAITPQISLGAAFNSANAYSVGHFFGLNNIFDTPDFFIGQVNSGLAGNLRIRTNVEDNPNLICLGKLNTDPALAVGQEATPPQNFDVANGMIDFFNNTHLTFTTAAGTPISGTLKEYAGRIIADQAEVVAHTNRQKERQEHIHQGLAEIYNKEAGVDREETMQKLMEIVVSQKMISAAFSKLLQMQTELVRKLG